MTFNLITRLKTTDEFKFIGGTGMIALIVAFAQNQQIEDSVGCDSAFHLSLRFYS